jgi:hypothetical protein
MLTMSGQFAKGGQSLTPKRPQSAVSSRPPQFGVTSKAGRIEQRAWTKEINSASQTGKTLKGDESAIGQMLKNTKRDDDDEEAKNEEEEDATMFLGDPLPWIQKKFEQNLTAVYHLTEEKAELTNYIQLLEEEFEKATGKTILNSPLKTTLLIEKADNNSEEDFSVFSGEEGDKASNRFEEDTEYYNTKRKLLREYEKSLKRNAQAYESYLREKKQELDEEKYGNRKSKHSLRQQLNSIKLKRKEKESRKSREIETIRRKIEHLKLYGPTPTLTWDELKQKEEEEKKKRRRQKKKDDAASKEDSTPSSFRPKAVGKASKQISAGYREEYESEGEANNRGDESDESDPSYENIIQDYKSPDKNKKKGSAGKKEKVKKQSRKSDSEDEESEEEPVQESKNAQKEMKKKVSKINADLKWALKSAFNSASHDNDDDSEDNAVIKSDASEDDAPPPSKKPTKQVNTDRNDPKEEVKKGKKATAELKEEVRMSNKGISLEEIQKTKKGVPLEEKKEERQFTKKNVSTDEQKEESLKTKKFVPVEERKEVSQKNNKITPGDELNEERQKTSKDVPMDNRKEAEVDQKTEKTKKTVSIEDRSDTHQEPSAKPLTKEEKAKNMTAANTKLLSLLVTTKVAKKSSIRSVYDFKEVLGQGAFGLVFEGIPKKSPNERVAIKTITKAKLTPTTEKWVLSEVQILKTLYNPRICIVRLIDFYVEIDNYYIVMEKILGGELLKRLTAKKTYSEKEARDLVKILLSGIKHCHDNNVVHRDLKPRT